MIKFILLLIIILILLFLVISRINHLVLFSRMPKLFIALVFLSLTLVSLISLRFLNNIESKGTYVPAKYDGEELIPGKVEFEK